MSKANVGKAIGVALAILALLVLAMIPLVWLAGLIEKLVFWEWGWIVVILCTFLIVWLISVSINEL